MSAKQVGLLECFKLSSGSMAPAEAIAATRKRQGEASEKVAQAQKKRTKERALVKKRERATAKHPWAHRMVNVGELPPDARGHPALPPDAVYIGGPRKLNNGQWLAGSLFAVPKEVRQRAGEDRAELVRLYRQELAADPSRVAQLARRLGGQRLACWCHNLELCHGPVILELIAKLEAREEARKRFGFEEK